MQSTIQPCTTLHGELQQLRSVEISASVVDDIAKHIFNKHMVVTRNLARNEGKRGTGTSSEGAKPGRCQSVQQALPGRHQVTDCRVEVVPLDAETVRIAVERMGNPQNLATNRFQNQRIKNRENFQWKAEKKIRLVELDEEERSKGRGFMIRLKERWDREFPEDRFLTAQNLRDNASRLKKDNEVMKLVGVRKRVSNNTVAEMAEVEVEELISTFDFEGEVEERNEDEENLEVLVEEAGDENIELSEEETDVERIFLDELGKLSNINELVEKARERLSKVNMASDLIEKTNKVLKKYLVGKETLNDIVNAVYAMGKTVMKIMGVKEKKDGVRLGKANRRERKKLDRIKELRQWIARISNELHRRKQRRKATNKEKKILKDLGKMMRADNIPNSDLVKKKEEMLDEMRYQQVTLNKLQTRAKKIKDNKMFVASEGSFYRDLRQSGEREGQVPAVDKFVDFWSNIWEDDSVTTTRPWMQDIQEALEAKVVDVKDFDINLAQLCKEVKKRKNWTAPGIDGIQNYWWKKFCAVGPPLAKVLNKVTDDPSLIPEWFTLGRTVLLPKTNNLNEVSDYRPITCLNTIYKIYTGVIANFMKDHAMRNNLWDDGQLGAREGVLGTIDQLLVDECIMQQVRDKKRNIAVAYYDYKKAYDMVHHDWMIRVYKWMGVPDKVCNVLNALMRLWKTRLEIHVGGQKQVSRWINIMRGFLQGDSFSPVGFCLTEVPIGELISHSRGYVMGCSGQRENKRTHSLFIDDLKVYAKSHENL